MSLKSSLIAAAASILVATGSVPAVSEPLRIGIVEDQTGVFSALSGPGTIHAARMAITDFGGEVLGRPIELVVADDQNKPDIGLATARQWYDQGVSMIMGLASSAVAIAVQKLAEDRGKVNIAIGAATTELTGAACSPTGFQWAINTYSFARGIVDGVQAQGGKKWFFITVDYALGHSLEGDASKMIAAGGGTVVGSARHPLGTTDYSSYILKAMSTDADVVALAMAGTDLENAIKAANEFGLTSTGKQVTVFLLQSPSMLALGLDTVKGVITPTTFYPEQNAEALAWSKRFMETFEQHRQPTLAQAGAYSAVTHYLKAVQAAGTDEGVAVAAKMHELPINDFYSKDVVVREDGQALRDVFITRIKSAADSKSALDLVDLVATIPGADANRSLADGGCDFVSR